jgi:hypothetical protein
VPAYVIDERVVWGMTFHLLERFLAQVLRSASAWREPMTVLEPAPHAARCSHRARAQARRTLPQLRPDASAGPIGMSCVRRRPRRGQSLPAL